MYGINNVEWLIIGGVVLLLFVPGLAAFGLGYLLGQKTAPGAPAQPDPGTEAPVSLPGSVPGDAESPDRPGDAADASEGTDGADE